jgi:hypothetical protein
MQRSLLVNKMLLAMVAACSLAACATEDDELAAFTLDGDPVELDVAGLDSTEQALLLDDGPVLADDTLEQKAYITCTRADGSSAGVKVILTSETVTPNCENLTNAGALKICASAVWGTSTSATCKDL